MPSLRKPLYNFGIVAVLLAAGSVALTKEPVTEGEADPVMKDLDPYLIEAFYGSDSKGHTGRFGA